VTGSPVELLVVVLILIAVVHAFVPPPIDTRWRDDIETALLRLDANQRRLYRPPPPPPLLTLPAPRARVESPAADVAPLTFDVTSDGVTAVPSPQPARAPVDPTKVRDWSDDAALPPWSGEHDPRVPDREVG
jgi:hypothetical protein